MSSRMMSPVTDSATPLLELCDVFKGYAQGRQTVQAVRGVSLAIREPGFYAIMGRSGSGKTTLLQLLAGLDVADRGRVSIHGENLSDLRPHQLTLFRRHRVGIVFQQFNLIPTLTARQNIALPGVIDRRPRAWLAARVQELLDRLDIAHRAEHRPEALSGGEQQRVAIARALLFSPPILLADEPTGNLDSTTSLILWNLLAELAAQQQMLVLMVTHEPAAAVRCRHVYLLADGRLAGDFPINGLDASGVAARCQQLVG